MSRGDGEPDPRSGPVSAVRWFLSTDHESVVFVRELVSSAMVVVLIGVVLFGVSGVWPPMVAVESGSMTPHMVKGDLIFVMNEHRFPPSAAHGDTGIVTYQEGTQADYQKFSEYGDVIIYQPYGATDRTPIIHRARFWVNAGEDWTTVANPAYMGGKTCGELATCPARHDGFITKGDHNHYYDQAEGISNVVKPTWIRGKAEFRIPYLGWVRLMFSNLAITPTPTVVPAPAPAPSVSGPSAPGATRGSRPSRS